MLSHRLLTIANMIERGKVVADVGSDHGLLPCFLVKEGFASKAYAIDNKEGPLSSSIENIKKYQLDNLVIPVLSDGLKSFNDEADVLVIAGMGFSTIKMILEDDIQKTQQFETIIVQSNTEVEALRKYIIDRSWNITNEKIIHDKNKYYFIIEFNFKHQSYEPYDYLIGPILKKQNDPLYCEYLELEIESRKRIMNYKKTPSSMAELEYLKEFIKSVSNQ